MKRGAVRASERVCERLKRARSRDDIARRTRTSHGGF